MSFDLLVHRRDNKGKIVSESPYRMLVVNGQQQFERPLDSGLWYDANGTLIREDKKVQPEAPAKDAKVTK